MVEVGEGAGLGGTVSDGGGDDAAVNVASFSARGSAAVEGHGEAFVIVAPFPGEQGLGRRGEALEGDAAPEFFLINPMTAFDFAVLLGTPQQLRERFVSLMLEQTKPAPDRPDASGLIVSARTGRDERPADRAALSPPHRAARRAGPTGRRTPLVPTLRPRPARLGRPRPVTRHPPPRPTPRRSIALRSPSLCRSCLVVSTFSLTILVPVFAHS